MLLEPPVPLVAAAKATPVTHLRVLVVTSDAGGDQSSAQRALAGIMAGAMGGDGDGGGSSIFIAQFCLQHQLHLVVLKSLRRLQSAGRYLSRLAQVTHSWRGAANKTKAAFIKLFGEDVGKEVANTPPPQPLRGRWGAVHSTEDRLLRCGRERLGLVSTPECASFGLLRSFRDYGWPLGFPRGHHGGRQGPRGPPAWRALGRCLGGPRGEARHGQDRSHSGLGSWGARRGVEPFPAGVVSVPIRHLLQFSMLRYADVFGDVGDAPQARDGPAADVEVGLTDETTAEWQAKMGRWRAEAIAALQDTGWWAQLVIAHATRQPVVHLMRWLEQASGRRARGEADDSKGPSPVVELVCVRLAQLQTEVGKLLDEPAAFADLGNLVPAGAWRPQALLLVLEQSADLHRRLFAPASEWPLCLCWLVWKPHDEVCSMRQHVSARLLLRKDGGGNHSWSQTAVAIDAATGPLSRIFSADLQAAAKRGTLSPRMYGFLQELSGPQPDSAVPIW